MWCKTTIQYLYTLFQWLSFKSERASTYFVFNLATSMISNSMLMFILAISRCIFDFFLCFVNLHAGDWRHAHQTVCSVKTCTITTTDPVYFQPPRCRSFCSMTWILYQHFLKLSPAVMFLLYHTMAVFARLQQEVNQDIRWPLDRNQITLLPDTTHCCLALDLKDLRVYDEFYNNSSDDWWKTDRKNYRRREIERVSLITEQIW